MAELVPIPLDLQLRRAFAEYEHDARLFGLPRDKFFLGLPGLDTSVVSNGHRAATPLGPAAGPHTQLLQNIVLCWLGGARIIELKTVQVLDELQIPRPCIDARNVTYNVEWSQELRLEQSLREYVSASMFLSILKASQLLGHTLPAGFGDTVFDMSAGYNLEGIRSPKVRAWLAGMKDASALIDELRGTLTGRFRDYRDLPFSPCISDTITLSTFHGCPAEEIEGIVTFLLSEIGLNVCVKMNPTLLGREQVSHLLHDVLGYRDIVLSDKAFESDLKFTDALDLVPRLQGVAARCGRQLSLKFSNTLVVRNSGDMFKDELMYMSGAPLHVLTLNLVKQFRESMGASVPLSFSAGLTAQNVADAVAMNFVPVTTCTDLLKTGGYTRLQKYMLNLGEAMHAVGATTISEFVLRHAGQGSVAVDRTVNTLRRLLSQTRTPEAALQIEAWLTGTVLPMLQETAAVAGKPLQPTCADVCKQFSTLPHARDCGPEFATSLFDLPDLLAREAGVANTPILVEHATADPRYRAEQNRSVPKKVGTQLSLFDCVTCDKCLPVCPNNANFAYESVPVEIRYDNYALSADGSATRTPGGVFRIAKPHQIANFADACNECGNCDVFCPEAGGPFAAKPRFFGSMETYLHSAGTNGFHISRAGEANVIHGTIGDNSYKLTCDQASRCEFEDRHATYVLDGTTLVSWRAKNEPAPQQLDLLPYLQLKFLLDATSDTRHIHNVNVALTQGD